jgi:hypothetical protein
MASRVARCGARAWDAVWAGRARVAREMDPSRWIGCVLLEVAGGVRFLGR